MGGRRADGSAGRLINLVENSITSDDYGAARRTGAVAATASRIRIAAELAILLAIFTYYFVENFILSSSWAILNLRSIDDMAMQSSMRNMQKHLLAGDFSAVICFFDYAYGCAFWLFNSLILLPFYFLDLPQAQIIFGRQISLGFMVGTIYLVGRIIDRLYPEARSLKYSVLIALAAMPMNAVIATKLHVNAQSIFFGLLAYHTLIADSTLTRSIVIRTAVFAGISVGLKLTGIFIMPLIGGTLLLRLREVEPGVAGRLFAAFCGVFVVTSVGCTAPVLLLFPFYIGEVKTLLATFTQFKNLGSAPGLESYTWLDGMSYFLFAPAVAASLILSINLIIRDIKAKQYHSVLIAATILSATIYVSMTVQKTPIYIATYILNVGVLVPIGLVGAAYLRLPRAINAALVTAIVGGSIYFGHAERLALTKDFRFFEMANSAEIDRQRHALADIEKLIAPLSRPVRVLQDHSASFPVTRFDDGVDLLFNYGNLNDYRAAKLGAFDYIVLNTSSYIGLGQAAEESLRKTLREHGRYADGIYRNIYEDNDTVLYKFVKLEAPSETSAAEPLVTQAARSTTVK